MKLKLMAEYECWPLWVSSGPADRRGNLDPGDLPLQETTHRRLEQWARWFETTYQPDDPASSGFAEPAALDAFNREGQLLAELLRAELGDRYEITFVPAT